MTTYKPPIAERETNELIEIANSDTTVWQKDAIDQAIAELHKRGVSREDQDEVVEKWRNEIEEFVHEKTLTREKNKTESYKKWQMFLIFLFAPFLFVNPNSMFTKSLFDLKRGNYLLKFKQRIIIYIFSFAAYFACIAYYAHWKQKQFDAEIERSDITEWKKLNNIK